MADPTTEQEWQRKFLIEQIEGVAARLRSLAADVEHRRLDVERVGQLGRPSYASVARDVQHDVLWGLANLHIDNLTTTAYDADRARLEEVRGDGE